LASSSWRRAKSYYLRNPREDRVPKNNDDEEEHQPTSIGQN
jgi:ribosomal protein L19